jgi:hypothetical protein
MDKVTKIFWLTTVAAVPLAFLVPLGPVRWAAISWLALLGVICAISNWVTIAAYFVRRRRGSTIPLLGGLCMGAALAAVPTRMIGHWIIWGALLDPWPIVFAVWPLARIFKADGVGR